MTTATGQLQQTAAAQRDAAIKAANEETIALSMPHVIATFQERIAELENKNGWLTAKSDELEAANAALLALGNDVKRLVVVAIYNPDKDIVTAPYPEYAQVRDHLIACMAAGYLPTAEGVAS